MTTEKTDKESYRLDQDKPQMSLIDPWAAEGLAKVLTFGARKYNPWNWKKTGFQYSRTLDSLHRHLAAFERGEDIDPESRLPHIDHLGANWMFLSFYTKEMAHLDDRFKHKKETNDPK